MQLNCASDLTPRRWSYMTEGLDKLPLKIGVILNSPVTAYLMNTSYITLQVCQPLTNWTASFLRTGAKSRAGYKKLKSGLFDFRKKKTIFGKNRDPC